MNTHQLAPIKVMGRLKELGLHPRKGLAQHFLVNRGALGRILKAGELTADDTVIEVGPGLGILTEELAQRVKCLITLELDRELAQALARRFVDSPQVQVLCADARKIDLNRLLPKTGPYKVVANLPYYAANFIVRRFLEAAHKPSLLVVMVQREVARRMTARPGNMALLSVAVQVYGNAKIVAMVPPGSFRPAPKVTSAVVRIEPYAQPLLAQGETEQLLNLARAGFSASRKQLQGVLTHALEWPAHEVQLMLLAAGVEPKRRAETLSVEEWVRLYEVFRHRNAD